MMSRGDRARRAAGGDFVIKLFGVVAVICSLAAPVGAESPLSPSLAPSDELSPTGVVRIQLEALRHNDDDDRGIEVAFRFASPANKRNTGPLPRFIRMIKEGPYRLMLEYRTVDYGEPEVTGRRARQRVILVGDVGVIAYTFYLSRQTEGPCVDCWMTDAVTVEPFTGQSA